jgi:hypothetical protein
MSIPQSAPHRRIFATLRAYRRESQPRRASIKKAVSYCGLCGDEQSSANSVQRTPLSKQRNKHLQTTLIEAPRYSPDLALLYEICPAQRLRPADYIPYINSVRAMLPWPQKPADPTQMKPESTDSRLHVEPRQPGQSSFRQLQEARAAHINGERKAREEARARGQDIAVNPAKVEAARQVNNDYAALIDRHGRNQ